MRILVTGGAGFIGSNLCTRLVSEGHGVICLDNFYTGAKANVEHLLGEPRFELIRHDLQEPIRLEVDQVYHLACPASPVHYQADPIRTLKTAFLGTLNMLGLAKRLRVPLLLASTSEVYGDPQVHPQTEDYCGNVNPIGVRGCYDEGKRVAETLVSSYRRHHGVDGRIARIFNTYGPGMQPNDGRVVSNFIVQALRHQPLTIFGDGSQTRSFCYIDDMVEGLIRMMQSPDCAGPVNLGNPKEYTVAELARLVQNHVSGSTEVVHKPLPADDPKVRRPDITAARRHLGWEPRVGLEEGLRATIAYFRRRVDSPVAV